ncbi:MAG TPA: hypothetical protein DCQ51_00205 [Planktothrix sp. UBA8407]|jgi:Glucose-6-phosphate 1-dehydrogenase|nr:hypothetical protein [Planktothrix sp. UBA8407]HBK22696.1 hypothetical protein [Planktothrix sp. UBA10369]
MNILSLEKIASLNLKDFPNRLLVCFGGTTNEARLWLIQLYQYYLENQTAFTILSVDNWSGTQGAYRADIAADLRDYFPDKLIGKFVQNLFYYSFDFSSQDNEQSQDLEVFIQQLKQERKLEKEIIVILANESYNVPIIRK